MPRTCDREETCEEERYSKIGMEYHIIREHDLRKTSVVR